MDSRSLFIALLIVVPSVLVNAEQAAAVQCGAGERSTLTLDEKAAVTSLTFKRSTGRKTASLIFNTSCDLTSLDPPPLIFLLPQRGLDELPDEAIAVKRTDVDGSTFELILTVDPKRFPPGSYGTLVVIRGSYLAPNRTPIAVSRSEASAWKPIGIGAVAAFVSFLWFAALKFVSRAKLQVSWWWLILVAVLAVGAGMWGVTNSYWDQDVWTVDANWRATAVAGFTGASTGAIAAVLGAIWLAPKKE